MRARLVDCFELSADTFEAHAHRHCVAACPSLTYKRAFAWVLEQAERFEKPFAYAHRPGAVVWVDVRWFEDARGASQPAASSGLVEDIQMVGHFEFDSAGREVDLDRRRGTLEGAGTL